MKNFLFVFLAFLSFVLISCADNSNTTDTTTTGDTNSAAESKTTPPPTPAQEYAAPPSKVKVDEVEKDTPRTSISVGRDGASVKTKSGTGVSYDKEGVKVGTKDVKIDIKRDTLK